MRKTFQNLKSTNREDIVSTIRNAVWKVCDPFTQTEDLTVPYGLRAFKECPPGVAFSTSIILTRGNLKTIKSGISLSHI